MPRTTRHQTLIRRQCHIIFPTKRDRLGLPVVLLFHGGGSNGATVLWESKFLESADTAGFAVVIPEGTALDYGRPESRTWNDGRLLVNGDPHPADDIAFVRAIIKALPKSLRGQPIFAAGYSNGAQFCYRLLHDLLGVFSAIGCVAGHRGPNALAAWTPITKASSIIQFCGQLDTIAPFGGGKPSIEAVFDTVIPNAQESAKAWALLGGALKVSQTDSTAHSITHTWRLLGGREVVLWNLLAGGHTWPGGNVEPMLRPVLGPVSQACVAAEEMCRFFAKHI